MQNTRRNFA